MVKKITLLAGVALAGASLTSEVAAIEAKKTKAHKKTKKEGEVIDESAEKRPAKSKESHKDRKMEAAKAKKYTGDLVELSPGSKMPATGLGMCCRPSARPSLATGS